MPHYLSVQPPAPQHYTIVPISGIASTFLGVYIMPSRGTGLLIHGYKHLSMLAFQTKAAVFPSSYLVLTDVISHSPDPMLLDSPCARQSEIPQGFLPRLSYICFTVILQ